MDADGILSVSAKDKFSGKEQAIRITPSTGLGKNEIDRMVQESKQFSEDDKKQKELAELRNRIRAQESAVSRSYSDFGWLLDSAEQEMVRSAIQKSKGLPSEGIGFESLKDLLTQLETCAARLSALMCTSGIEGLRTAEAGEPADEGDIDRLLKSALDDVNTKLKIHQ
jgi:molecular chaperone DnaK